MAAPHRADRLSGRQLNVRLVEVMSAVACNGVSVGHYQYIVERRTNVSPPVTENRRVTQDFGIFSSARKFESRFATRLSRQSALRFSSAALICLQENLHHLECTHAGRTIKKSGWLCHFFAPLYLVFRYTPHILEKIHLNAHSCKAR